MFGSLLSTKADTKEEDETDSGIEKEESDQQVFNFFYKYSIPIQYGFCLFQFYVCTIPFQVCVQITVLSVASKIVYFCCILAVF